MKKIGILSDTHSYWDPKYLHYFEPCDEIWHAGDIGSLEVAEKLAEFRPFRAVCGNCDGGDLRLMYHELNRFRCENVDVLIKHIGGYPGHYNPWLIPWFRKSLEAKNALINAQMSNDPINEQMVHDQMVNVIDLFVCGHSHILKVQYDPLYKFLTMNPGAAGKQGWQPCQTLLRFTIDGSKIDNLEVIELERL